MQEGPVRRLDYMVFSHVKRIGKLRRTFEEVVKRDLAFMWRFDFIALGTSKNDCWHCSGRGLWRNTSKNLRFWWHTHTGNFRGPDIVWEDWEPRCDAGYIHMTWGRWWSTRTINSAQDIEKKLKVFGKPQFWNSNMDFHRLVGGGFVSNE